VLERVRVSSPFLVRSVEPPIEEAQGKTVTEVRRLGKRIVLHLDDDLYLVFHLMIAGRLRWLKRGARLPGKIALAAFEFGGGYVGRRRRDTGVQEGIPAADGCEKGFSHQRQPSGTLVLTEAGAKKRASLHLVRGEAALAELDPGGLEVLEADAAASRAALRRENHTLKRALTDPRLFSGIGNAYSDEILHAARLSPVMLTSKLSDEQADRLHAAARRTLTHWIDKLRQEFGERFPGPGEITAFRPDFAVHGRFGLPCPDCGCLVQRIRYAENETNYCPRCQTGGRILADRSLSRLLKYDWPRTIEELEGR